MSDPVRIFVGAPPNGLDAESQMVCEYTLRKHASEPLLITWLITSNDPQSLLYGWDLSQCVTPFSPYRWAVPALAETGKAIYCDCDTIAQSDIVELWNIPLPAGAVVAARGGWRYCVSLWDCERALGVMLPLQELRKSDGHARQNAFFKQHPKLTYNLGPMWNYLDDEAGSVEAAKVLHYSSLRSQPSMRHAVARLRAEGRSHWNKRPFGRHPRPEITQAFEVAFAEAREAGYTTGQYY